MTLVSTRRTWRQSWRNPTADKICDGSPGAGQSVENALSQAGKARTEWFGA
ncbi:MAG: hypothetical protein FWH11_10275 [Micrococcales bacterium]|nr:hypothetical protein [Micrococcales bacterium]